MKRVLIAYDSGYGATRKVAEIIKSTIDNLKFDCEIQSVDTPLIDTYDLVLVGSPIRIGSCTKKLRKFLKDNYSALKQYPVGFFFTCMSVTKHEQIFDFPLFIDPSFKSTNKDYEQMLFMEKNHTSTYYINQIEKLIPNITPLSIAFFKGILDSKRLTIPHRFIMFVAKIFLPEIKDGDYVNPKVVQDWIKQLKLS